MFILAVLFSALLATAQTVTFDEKAEAGCGCRARGPRGPFRNPNVCTEAQLKHAAIALTRQMQSYVNPYDRNALFDLVSPITPVFENGVHNIPEPTCCQQEMTLAQYYDSIYQNGLIVDFFNPIPMGAVSVGGTVEIYSMEVMYNPTYWYVPIRDYQIVYHWKPQYQCGVPVNTTTCNLVLDRIETRFTQCSFGEAVCPL